MEKFNDRFLMKLQELQQTIRVAFHNQELLTMALTHPSYQAEHPEEKNHNQRLEFLGDAILGSVVADYLYRHYPQYSEGQLTRMRAAVVCEATLARLGESLKLGEYLRLGRGEEISGGRKRSSILADALEAVTGAVFLDQGWEVAKSFINSLLHEELERTGQGFNKDYKTSLQELLQQRGSERICYLLLSESGPDHAKEFVSGVIWRNQLLGKGTGRSKKEAEQQAARAALDYLNQQDISPK